MLALLPDHGGALLQRVCADGTDGRPDEIQLIGFATQAGLDGYLADPRRTALAAAHDRAIARTDTFPVDTPTGAIPGGIAGLELRHRQHARVEDRIRETKQTGLRNFPCYKADPSRPDRRSHAPDPPPRPTHTLTRGSRLAISLTAERIRLAVKKIVAREWLGKRGPVIRRGSRRLARAETSGIPGPQRLQDGHHGRGDAHPGVNDLARIALRRHGRRTGVRIDDERRQQDSGGDRTHCNATSKYFHLTPFRSRWSRRSLKSFHPRPTTTTTPRRFYRFRRHLVVVMILAEVRRRGW